MNKMYFMISAICALMMIACDDEPSSPPMMGGVTPSGGVEAGSPAGAVEAGTPAGAIEAGTPAGAIEAGTPAGAIEAGTPAGGVMGGDPMGGDPMGGAEAGIPLNELVAVTAQATCEALYRCCDGQNVTDFFAPIVNGPRYEEIASQLPPNVAIDAATCPEIMGLVLDTAPFGSWISAVERGEVTYDGLQAEVCLNTLNSASCGDELLSALYDGTCLSYSAPLGGDQQRKMFTRSRGVGESCGALYDGVGGVFYGTCDPEVAFCCRRDDRGDCLPASEGAVGECVAVSAEGEACSAFPAQLCATGYECSVDGRCEAPNTTPLSIGETCTENFSPLGDCIDSFCDFGGSDQCTALLADGEACGFHYECLGGSCVMGICQESNFCIGG